MKNKYLILINFDLLKPEKDLLIGLLKYECSDSNNIHINNLYRMLKDNDVNSEIYDNNPNIYRINMIASLGEDSTCKKSFIEASLMASYENFKILSVENISNNMCINWYTKSELGSILEDDNKLFHNIEYKILSWIVRNVREDNLLDRNNLTKLDNLIWHEYPSSNMIDKSRQGDVITKSNAQSMNNLNKLVNDMNHEATSLSYHNCIDNSINGADLESLKQFDYVIKDLTPLLELINDETTVKLNSLKLDDNGEGIIHRRDIDSLKRLNIISQRISNNLMKLIKIKSDSVRKEHICTFR